MRILAIDPSLSRTGVCIDGQCLSVATNPSLSWRQRVQQVLSELVRATLGPRDVDLVVVEECIVGRAVHVPSMWLHGLIRWNWDDRPIVDIHPSRRMKFACGDQKERGKDAVLLRAERAGAKAENNDEADAWWMWKMATTAYTPALTTETGYPTYKLEVLASIDWPEVNGYKPQWEKPKKPTKKKVSA